MKMSVGSRMSGYIQRSLRGLKYLYLIIIFVFANSALADPATDALMPFLDSISTCTKSQSLKLAVVGVDSDQKALSREEAEEIRLTIETRLQATGRVRLAPSADVVQIKKLREETTGTAASEIDAQIRLAFDGDASVFIVAPGRTKDGINFRLQAVTRNTDCKITSEVFNLAVKVGPQLNNIDAVMDGAVKSLFQAAPNATEIEVCPFVAEGGHSNCAGALTDRLLIALDKEARSATRVLRGSVFEVRRTAPGTSCGVRPEVLSARGIFSRDRDNRTWMNIEFQRDGAVLAPTGRRQIGVDGLGCDPAPRNFLDYIAETARIDSNRLSIMALSASFSKGQRVEVRIDSRVRQNIYCWILAPDQTAFVALPVRGNSASAAVLKPGDVRRYPRDYGLEEMVASEPFENLFSCFGVEGGLPPELQKRWLLAAPASDSDPALLEPKDVLDLLEQIRATPGVVEARTAIVVR
jgi:hypothetical protein